MPEAIDAVYTWVDGSDPAHAQKRRQYAHEAKQAGVHWEANASTRFAEWGELWYSVRLLRKNAPWIRNVYIVTDGQRPEWLTPSQKSELGVSVVDHREVFDGYSEYLPTFNGRTVEAVLHRIPGLAGRFLSLNDDFFIVNPVEPSDYFHGRRPVIPGRWVWRNKLLRGADRVVREAVRAESPYSGLVGSRAEVRWFKQWKDFRLYHAPRPIDRELYDRAMTRELLRRTLRYRFRHDSQISPIAYYANHALRAGEAEVGPPSLVYLQPGDVPNDLDRSLDDRIRREVRRHLCVQSLERFSASDRGQIERFLEDLIEGGERKEVSVERHARS